MKNVSPWAYFRGFAVHYFNRYMKLLKRRLRERCFPVNFMKFLRIFLRIAYSGCFCIFKISVPLKEFTSSFDYNCLNLQNKCKIFTVNKIKKSVKDFSLLNTFFFSATSCKCLCTHFGHMAKIETSLNILLPWICKSCKNQE